MKKNSHEISNELDIFFVNDGNNIEDDNNNRGLFIKTVVLVKH